MTQEEKNILEAYANAKVAESDAKAIVEELKDQVVAIVEKYTEGEADDMVIIPQGKFTVSKRRKYAFSQEVIDETERLEGEIQKIKEVAQQRGDGDYQEAITLTFTKDKSIKE